MQAISITSVYLSGIMDGVWDAERGGAPSIGSHLGVQTVEVRDYILSQINHMLLHELCLCGV